MKILHDYYSVNSCQLISLNPSWGVLLHCFHSSTTAKQQTAFCLSASCRWSSASRRAACCSGPAPVLKRCTTWCWAAGRGSPTWGWTSRRSTACSRASPRPHPSTWTYWAEADAEAPVFLYVLCVHMCELTSGCVCLSCLHTMRRSRGEEMRVVRLCERLRLCTVPGCKCYCKCCRPCPHYIREKP